MKALVIGGTRNLGPSLIAALVQAGYSVTVFHRGVTAGPALPEGVERLHGDRSNEAQLAAAVTKRKFDLVVDTTIYTGAEARAIVRIFQGRVGRYIFLSTGQVYLVRQGLERPYREQDYDGIVMADPGMARPHDHDDWIYGVDKRAAEDVFRRAWETSQFPFTSLRLPMVNSELDHHDRVYNYFLRLEDGGPIVAPEITEGGELPLRHVYGGDVTQAVLRLASGDACQGRAVNISQDETLTLESFLITMAGIMHRSLHIARLPREILSGFLPACSPFSGEWMSVLDNQRSKIELGMQYTPVATYLEKLIAYHRQSPRRDILGYRARARELELLET
jgi:2'-hydroxyisoflavone reductase